MNLTKLRDRFKTKINRQTVVRFLDKQGFYIVLFICISIIAATAFWASGRNEGPQEIVDDNRLPEKKEMVEQTPKDDAKEADTIDVKVRDIIVDEPPVKQESKKSQQLSKSTKEHENPKPAAKPVISQKKSSRIIMTRPAQGNILKEFSVDELVYSKTLKEWATHPGLDIECPLGGEVKAALGGIIKKVEEDPLMGYIIVIDHGNGLKTRYANLSTLDMVTEGQKVEAGQTISGIGRTAAVEISDAPHLHFEVIYNDEHVDPQQYFE